MTSEEMLRKLIREYFWVNDDGRLEWGYMEGVGIGDIEADFEKHILNFQVPDPLS